LQPEALAQVALEEAVALVNLAPRARGAALVYTVKEQTALVVSEQQLAAADQYSQRFQVNSLDMEALAMTV
jgi:hypothetical protein